jgi:hypothetical protein
VIGTARRGPLLRILDRLAPARPQRVGFLVAGMQKSGTTTFAEYLEQHPDIGLARVKEVHHFDDERLDWAGRPDDLYHAAFDFRGPAAIWGECTPSYSFWEPAHARIHAYNPDMKLVLVVRDPVDRAFSHWRWRFGRGKETLPFAEAIREGRGRIPKHRWNGYRSGYSYVERGFYGRQLEMLLGRFPRQQIHIVGADALFRDAGAALGGVAGFLGVRPFPRVRAIHAKPAKPVEYPSRLTRADAAYLADLYRDDLALFARLCGLDTTGWLDPERYPA